MKLNQSLRESLKERLKYGNEFSLRKRLKEVYDKHSDIYDQFIKNKDNFVELTVNTRNYLIHFDKESNRNIAEGEDLYHLTEKLKNILEIMLLTKLGFESINIKDLISKNELLKNDYKKLALSEP